MGLVGEWPGLESWGVIATVEEGNVPTSLVTNLGVSRDGGQTFFDCPGLVLPGETFVLRITAKDDIPMGYPGYVYSDIYITPAILKPDGTNANLTPDHERAYAIQSVDFDYPLSYPDEGSYYLDVDIHIDRTLGGSRDGTGHYHVFDVSQSAPPPPSTPLDIGQMTGLMVMLMMMGMVMPMATGGMAEE